jgi:hypothetical protein
MIHMIAGSWSSWRDIVAVDIEGSTARPDPVKAVLRGALYDMLKQSLNAGGFAWRHDPLVDRGDGVLALIRPVQQAATISPAGGCQTRASVNRAGTDAGLAGTALLDTHTVLADTVIPHLAALLARHNGSHPDQHFRLRAVVHAGNVCYDHRGCFGQSLDIAFRLLDSSQVKQVLRNTRAPVVLVVSEHVHQRASQRRNGFAVPDRFGIPCFEPLAPLQIGHRRHRGWVRALPAPVPAHDA